LIPLQNLSSIYVVISCTVCDFSTCWRCLDITTHHFEKRFTKVVL